MTPEMLGGTIRTLMGLMAGYAAAAGMSGDTYMAVTGGVVALGTWAWSLWAKKQAADKLAAK
jgi:hypothetical protein